MTRESRIRLRIGKLTSGHPMLNVGRLHVPVIFLGSLALIVAAWGRVIVTPGEILQGDLTYALHADLLPRIFYPAWDLNRHSVLVSVGSLGTYGPFVAAGLLVGLSSATIMKSVVVGWALMGYVMASTGFRLLLGPSRGARAQTASESLGLALGSVFWILNPWFLARLEQLGVALAALGLPLAIGLMAYSIRSRRRLPAVGAGLVTMLISAASPHYLTITVVVLGLLWAVRFVQQSPDRITIFKIGVTYVLAVVGIGAFVWIPAVSTVFAGGQFQPPYVYEAAPVIVSTPTQTLWNTLTLTAHHFFGVSFRPSGLASVAWSAASLLGAGSLALAAVFGRRRSTWLFFGAVTGAFVALLSLSSLPSGGQMYELIVRAVPLGWLIREPDKLGALIPMGYALGIAWIVPTVMGLPAKREWPFKRCMSSLAVALVVGAMLVWMRPAIERSLFQTEFASYVPAEFPREYYEFTDEFRPMSDPNASVLVFNHPNRSPSWSSSRIVRGALVGSMRARVLLYALTPVGRLADSALADPGRFADTLLAAGVGAVALAVDDSEGERLAGTIASFPGVRERPGGRFIRSFDLIGAPAPLVDIGGLEPEWRRSAPTRYEIDLQGSRESDRLVLREFADPHWKAALGGKSLERSPDTLFNSWDLPASESGTITVTYEMQRYLVIGYAISGLIVVGFIFAMTPFRRVARGLRT